MSKRRGADSSSSETASPSPAAVLSLSKQPTTWNLAAAFICFRVAGTMMFPLIMDCDETFNYWEPTHYMLYGRGLQTWEYAPEFGLRSYAYTLIHATIGYICGAAWGGLSNRS